MIEELKAKVARNDVGDALGIRAEFHHPGGRVDSLALSFEDPIDEPDNAVLLERCRDDLLRWVEECKAAAPKVS